MTRVAEGAARLGKKFGTVAEESNSVSTSWQVNALLEKSPEKAVAKKQGGRCGGIRKADTLEDNGEKQHD